MQKIQNAKMLTALALLFVLVISPLAVVYGQTNSNTSVDLSTSGNITASGGSVKVDSAAKIVGDKLDIKNLREKIKSERAELKQRTDERRATIAFTGQTDGWILIGGIASKASISLKEGKAVKVGDHLWRISTNGTITAGSKNYDVHLKGKVEGNKRYGGAIVSLRGTAMIGGEEHRIALSGYVAPTSIEKTFALAFTNLGYKGEEYHFIQVGQVTTSPNVSADISSDQSQNDMASFRDTISVG